MSAGLQTEHWKPQLLQGSSAYNCPVSHTFIYSEVGLTPSHFHFGTPKRTVMPHQQNIAYHQFAEIPKSSGKWPVCLNHNRPQIPKMSLHRGFWSALLFTDRVILFSSKHKQSMTITGTEQIQKGCSVLFRLLSGRTNLPNKINGKREWKMGKQHANIKLFSFLVARSCVRYI